MRMRAEVFISSAATASSGARASGSLAGSFAPPPPENGYWSISRQIASFKPAESWQHVQARVLLVYGGRDERVPPRSSAAAIASALAAGGQPKPAVIFYPNADHLFVLPSSAKVGWPRRQPGYADKLIAWILQLP